MANVVETRSALSYDFDDEGPSYRLSHADSWTRTFKVDPAPCYTHDEGLARGEFERLCAACPLPMPLAVFILSHEKIGRTNGEYVDDHDHVAEPVPYVDKAGKTQTRYPPVGYIVLSGKRIPPHPAMTRYLVAHEYGHAVQHHLDRLRDADVLTDYAAVRPTASRAYGCGKWHAALGELFANDFRMLFGKETEFWPHAGFSRTEDTPAAVEWWARAGAELQWPAWWRECRYVAASDTPEHVESI